MRSLICKFAFITLSMMVLLCCSCNESGLTKTSSQAQSRESETISPEPEQPKEASGGAAENDASASQSPVAQLDSSAGFAKTDTAISAGPGQSQEITRTKTFDPNAVVAEIGEYKITFSELERKLRQSNQPRGISCNCTTPKSVDADTVLKSMIAEKALILNGRENKILQIPKIQGIRREHVKSRMIRYLMPILIKGNVMVTKEDIDKQRNQKPDITYQQAKKLAEKENIREYIDDYYEKLYQQKNTTKKPNNYSHAVTLHYKLLLRPEKSRTGNWIKKVQIQQELTEEQRQIVLASFDGGNVTFEDWLYELCKYSPPSRPKNLNEREEFEKILEAAIRTKLWFALAKERGIDKTEEFLAKMKKWDDAVTKNQAWALRYKSIPEYTDAYIKQYCLDHPETQQKLNEVNIKALWFDNLQAATEFKNKLDNGLGFDQAFDESPKKQKTHKNVKASREGIFFQELWEADPNDVIGPTKGFFEDELKWRIVKIIEKIPGENRGLESNRGLILKIKNYLKRKEREKIREKTTEEMLKKYSYKIYKENYEGLDFYDIP